MEIPSIDYIQTHLHGNHRCFERDFNEFYNWLLAQDGDTFLEKLYIYLHGRKHCLECGQPTKFKNFTKGFHTYCSNKCSNRSAITLDKSKQTYLERYGVAHIAQSEEVQKKARQTKLERYGDEHYTNREKVKQTCLERYGTPSPLQSKEILEKIAQTNLERYGSEVAFNSPEVQDKVKQTHLEKYGGNPSKTKEVKEKYKQTCLERYGVECTFQSEEIWEKARQTKLERYGDEHYTNLEKNKETCLERYGVPYGLLNKIPGYSKASQQLFNQLKEQFPNAMYATKGGEQRVGPYLLDWYDPDSNTVIEFNGDYWHANPKLCDPEWVHPLSGKTAKEIWEHDREKKEYLEAQGYKVFVVWESDIDKIENIIDIIKRL